MFRDIWKGNSRQKKVAGRYCSLRSLDRFRPRIEPSKAARCSAARESTRHCFRSRHASGRLYSSGGPGRHGSPGSGRAAMPTMCRPPISPMRSA